MNYEILILLALFFMQDYWHHDRLTMKQLRLNVSTRSVENARYAKPSYINKLFRSDFFNGNNVNSRKAISELWECNFVVGFGNYISFVFAVAYAFAINFKWHKSIPPHVQ